MDEHKHIVEINGIKIEVDLRTAKRIDEFKVGDCVKVLEKNHNGHNIYPGVIVDFVEFKTLPTIQIAVFKMDYSGHHLQFINFNSETKDYEFTRVSEHELHIDKDRVIDRINMEIEKKRGELMALENKKNYLMKHFGEFFKE